MKIDYHKNKKTNQDAEKKLHQFFIDEHEIPLVNFDFSIFANVKNLYKSLLFLHLLFRCFCELAF